MLVEIKTPMLPESVSEATVQQWQKQLGQFVARGEIVVMIETDKIALEVPAPNDGVLSEILKSEGDTIYENDVLAQVDTAASQPEKPSSNGEQAPAKTQVEAAGTEQDSDAGDAEQKPVNAPSPAARRLANDHNIDVGTVSGSGKDGRITKQDVQNAVDAKQAQAGPPSPPVDKPAQMPDPPQPAQIPDDSLAQSNLRAVRRQPMSRIRRTIADRLVQAQHTAALLTTFNEVDLTAVMAMRSKYRDSFETKHGARLGFMSFFVKAAVESLKSIPAVNAIIDENDIVHHEYCDIGIAVSSPRGLVVPIIRNAELKSFAQIEQQIASFGERAKSGTLTLDDLAGGTFTITNGGVFGSLVSTPIINPPQSAILGMHKIQQRPVAVEGQVVIRPMMYLALSYDHRIIDGREAVTFLVGIKDSLEDPSRLLLEL